MHVGRVLAGLPRTDAATVVRDGSRTVVAFGAVDALVAPRSPFTALDALTTGWWAGYAAYELGHAVEHVRPRPAGPGGGSRDPDLALVRFATRAVLAPDGTVEVAGAGAERRALERALADPTVVVGADPEPDVWHSSLDRCDYESRVLAVQELIRAGECYQVNLTRRLDGPPRDPVALWTAVTAGNPAPHAMFWSPGSAASGAPTVVSASPERFLRVDGRSVETRPIKGTAADATRLRASEKDRAENVMIVDLARNDLGRVCTPGSVT